MEWEAWCEVYPAREVEKVEDPQEEDGPFDTRKQAEDRKEWLEDVFECGGWEVVVCKGKFWVIRY